MFITRTFSDMKMGKKLGLSFFVLIMATLAIALLAYKGFQAIKENAQKQDITVDFVNSLGKARTSRLLYQYTKDNQYAQVNAKALGDLTAQVNKLKTFSWDSQGENILNTAASELENYKTHRDVFYNASQKTFAAASILQNNDLLMVGQQLDGVTLPTQPEAMLQVLRLASILKEIAGDVERFVDKPTESSKSEISDNITTVSQLRAQLLELSVPDIQAVLATQKTDLTQLRQAFTDYLSAVALETAASKQLSSTAERLNTSVAELFNYQGAESANVLHKAEMQIALVAVICVLLSLLIAWRITLSITVPLKETLSVAKRIAEGDLTTSLSTARRDELGQLMQAVSVMNESLQNIITHVRDGVNSVARASSEIAAGNMDLSSRTEQQSAAVVQTAASMEELTSTVKQNAENAHHASQLATEASANAGRGGEIIRSVVTTMQGITTSSGKIGEIISVINGISFQTNILALNAAVEAARAGEQGRGFAVVAGEVRNLAQRSAVAAKEIETLIRDSLNRVNEGSTLVDQAGTTMDEIVLSVTQVKDIMSEIAAASDEQNRGISQIAQAMTEMDTTTQQNAALVEESSAAASSLESQAEALEKTVAVFRVPSNKKSVVASQAVSSAAPKVVVSARQSSVTEANWETF
ncbi:MULTISPECIES: methyl-accepting chemotaxis protein [Pantoea]|uniref:Methyl-accepting chemotaxis protein n=1 Tax=Pantoea stewartii TaxID=66269 RepID=A0AB34VFQ4_9GAMM|nr:methyl-accepting chemotaxis protein [Pantoea stewartii]KTS73691.1 methyl-accepting chemotaxis protein [Pantoea stewartii]KTS96509.1 methyl-accepting chemotaxis protein [Pantoea stewartii]KTT06353.1 methyl-accepting chemotaxis protein [Pantoea stewartii]MCU7369016.1 methyl-accepting chemotaxis protein [Pantoea stewartii]